MKKLYRKVKAILKGYQFQVLTLKADGKHLNKSMAKNYLRSRLPNTLFI